MGTVEHVRLVFAGLAAIAVGGQIPLVMAGTHPVVTPPASAGCAIALLAVWWVGLRRGRFPAGAVVIELAATVGFALGFDDPAKAIGPVFAMLFFRCMYGTHIAAAGRAAAYSAALLAVYAWSPVPMASGVIGFVAVSVAILTVTMRTLATCLERILQANQLSTGLALAAREMISAATVAELYKLCETTGLALAPRAKVHVAVEAAGSVHDQQSVTRFTLGDSVELCVSSDRPLPAAQRTALQTLATQAYCALQNLVLRSDLAHRASHDQLTGLPNRSSYTAALSAALGSGESCAALFIDLDDFKTVNDTLGHAAGDALLIQVANRLQECLRSTDLAARLGGDEFAILVKDTRDAHAAATHVAGRVLAALEDPFDLPGTTFYTRCSIGVAVDGQLVALTGTATGNGQVPRPDHEIESATADLLRNADIAMYVAKARGKNRFEIFAPDMAVVATRDVDARQELAAGLARDEFELHFQPVVALASHTVATVEALIRWRHPIRGLLLPGEFLPLAEQHRLLPDIERWVLSAACREAATWPGEHPPSVSVNISPRHVGRNWLVPTVTQALATSGLPGNRLVLEITEEALVIDPVAAEENLRRCVAMGVQVAVDDFGAGHASLGSLRTLPVSTVKMDRSVLLDERGERIVTAVVNLAHALGLRVVAEGVETDEQLTLVQESGCDAVQGYLFARPTPAALLDLTRVGTLAHRA